MIIRIVKMTFQPSSSEEFKAFTKSIQSTIVGFDGCLHMEAYQDTLNPNVFFTYSHWESEERLNAYRESDFFKKTWAQTKQWFADKPKAWSVEKI